MWGRIRPLYDVVEYPIKRVAGIDRTENQVGFLIAGGADRWRL
ncbi:MAG: hypothetical protein ABSH33_17535 [Steroidobacteraceae bacterium]|jgi:hypothetical protein